MKNLNGATILLFVFMILLVAAAVFAPMLLSPTKTGAVPPSSEFHFMNFHSCIGFSERGASEELNGALLVVFVNHNPDVVRVVYNEVAYKVDLSTCKFDEVN